MLTRKVIVAAILTALLAGASPLLAAFAGTDVFVPLAGRKAGVPPSQWYSTLWIYNPNDTAAAVSIFLLERDRDNTAAAPFADVIQPGDTRAYPNTVWTLFAKQVYGALRITSDQKVVANSRFYSQATGAGERDSVGEDFAGIPAAFAIGLHETTDLLGVNQTTPAADADFRYNYGFVEVTGKSAKVRVTAQDETGAPLGSLDWTVPPLGQKQFAFKDGFPAVSTTNARLTVEVISGSGKVLAYGAGITNGSQDATTFEMRLKEAALGGAITGITAGAGLAGGGTSGAVTLDVGAGTGIAVDADTVGIQVPLTLTSDTAGATITGINSGGGAGLQGARAEALAAAGAGLRGASQNGVGVLGESTGLDGVVGFSQAAGHSGVYGHNNWAAGFGVSGINDLSNNVGYLGGTFALFGESPSGIGARVIAHANTGLWASSEAGIGVDGRSTALAGVSGTSTNGAGVSGTSSNGIGISGTSTSNIGVNGFSGTSTGVMGTSTSFNGVDGRSTNGPGVYGESTNGAGVRAVGHGGAGLSATSGTGFGADARSSTSTGVYGESTGGIGVNGKSLGIGDGVFGESGGHAVHGRSTGAGAYAGVHGENDAGGVGVWGRTSTGTGVLGHSSSGTGVVGESSSSFGVTATSSASNHPALAAYNLGGGEIFSAFSSSIERRFVITNDGNVWADGPFHTGGADYADMLPAEDGLEPGDVLVIGADGRLARSAMPFQANVAGVYSTRPAYIGGASQDGATSGKVPLAIVGVVPVKASTENGPIRPGDMLVASATPGHAMRAGDNPPVGRVLGKALSGLESGAGVITLLVMLH